jgi:hypothetical protein
MAISDRPYDLVLREAAATPNKRVLLVEGTGDVAFLTLMLDKTPLQDENIFADWVLAPAGGKDAVLRLLKERPDLHAMVDRDAWDENESANIERRFPNLHILPRFCIENYLICPEELTQAIPGFAELTPQIIKEIPQAVRHGCLWRAAQPLYEELLQAGFNRALLRYPPPDEGEMRDILTNWQHLLSPENVHQRMEEHFRNVRGESQQTLLHRYVHGKVFWRGCIENMAARFFPGKKSDELKREVYRRLTLPNDLETFMKGIFLAG